MVKKQKFVKKAKGPKNPWFRNEHDDSRNGWGFIPISIGGWVALFLLVALNVFAANYFDIMNTSFRDVSKFLVVFLLSLVVFILIAKKKTKGVSISKNGG